MFSKPDKMNDIISGKGIVRNTIFNLFGYGIPLLFAIILIPPLIDGLGEERFGILNLAWMVIGYFSFFDFGIGKGLTKILAEKVGQSQTREMPSLFWTSMFLMFAISTVASFIIVFFIPYFVNMFNVSDVMHTETINTFYILTFSIPIVSTTAGLRGVLEAYQKFGVINIMRIILGISTFVGPLIVLMITNSLFWIVLFLVILRIFIWIAYLFLCFNTNKSFKNNIYFDFNTIKPVLKFSVWITIANIVGPIILYSDRFLIGAVLSATAITYYASPYEIVTKLLLISGALTGVLFPIFSLSYLNDPKIAKSILQRGVKFIFLIIFPIVILISTFSYEGMKLWLGEKFAVNSALILQFLSIGILMNSLSSIPNNFFQGIGKPKIPTLVNLFELPFYLFAMWFAIKSWGINGAAMVYMIMASIDAIIMYVIAYKLYEVKFDSKFNLPSVFIMLFLLVIPFFIVSLFIKILFIVSVLIGFVLLSWKKLLSVEERNFLISRFKLKFS